MGWKIFLTSVSVLIFVPNKILQKFAFNCFGKCYEIYAKLFVIVVDLIITIFVTFSRVSTDDEEKIEWKLSLVDEEFVHCDQSRES